MHHDFVTELFWVTLAPIIFSLANYAVGRLHVALVPTQRVQIRARYAQIWLGMQVCLILPNKAPG